MAEPVVVDPYDALIREHWSGLVRVATLLLRDTAQAEDVVQEAIIACLRHRNRLHNPDAQLAYLRRAVVNTAHSALRRRRLALLKRPPVVLVDPGAEQAALAAVERDAVVRALRTLSSRQREAVVLRYYGDLSEKQTAAAMGCSVGAVKAYTSRGLAALRQLLGDLA